MEMLCPRTFAPRLASVCRTFQNSNGGGEEDGVKKSSDGSVVQNRFIVRYEKVLKTPQSAKVMHDSKSVAAVGVNVDRFARCQSAGLS